jgi:hypothetical protein
MKLIFWFESVVTFLRLEAAFAAVCSVFVYAVVSCASKTMVSVGMTWVSWGGDCSAAVVQ